MQIKMYGASDDLIEIDGDIVEEFTPSFRDEQKYYLAVSDGTVLRVDYDDDGCWRFVQIKKGTSKLVKVEALGSDSGDHPGGESGYSDLVVLTGDNLKWVLGGNDLAK